MTLARARVIAFFAVALALMASCRGRPREVSIYLSTDKQLTEPILRDYERSSGVHVRAVFVTVDTDHEDAIQRIIAEKDRPQADVLWSDDPVRLHSLIERGLVQRYVSRNALFVPCAFKSDDGSWTGTAAHASALLVNRDKVRPGEMPRSVRDLTDPKWKGQTAIASPLHGTIGIHLAALASTWGSDAFREFLNQLKANGTRVTRSRGDVIRLLSTGEIAFGLDDTDDTAASLYERARIQVVYPDQEGMGALLVPTAVILLKGPHPEEGRRLVHFLLSSRTEQHLVDFAARIPLRPGVRPYPEQREVSDIRTMKVDYAKVGETLERIEPWLQEWAGH